jgi:uncharacterized protein
MATQLLMPKATAVWLVENTALSFKQIADFCTLHPLEVQGIADGDVAGGIKGVSPIQNGQLTRDEITRAEADENYKLKLSEPKVKVAAPKRRGPRYTPTSRRHERPNAIKWLVRNHPELKDAQIMRLVGTTKSTIESVRDGGHWNSANLTAMDPVTLGLCSQMELDMEVRKAARSAGIAEDAPEGTRLLSAEEALSRAQYTEHTGEETEQSEAAANYEAEREAETVFAKLKSLKGGDAEDKE